MYVVKPQPHSFIQQCGIFMRDFQSRKKEKVMNLKDILMPLKTSEYDVQIANTIANITLVQTYQNPTDKYLEIYYRFPVNPNSCVYRFIASFGNKRIEGIVKEKEQAKQEYKKAISSGKQAALGAFDPKNGNILNLQIGNIGPGQIVKIQITYLQELTLSSNMFYELHMVGTASPQYMEFIPKNKMMAGYRNEQAKAKGQFYWNFRITLRTSKKVCFFDSKSHDIQLVSQNDSQTQSVFAMEKSCLPYKDFTFTYTTQDYEQPSYVLGRTDMSSTAMVSFIPKFCQLNINDAYKASVSGTPFQTDIDNVKGQYIFLLDRSGSMQGKRINKAKEALVLFIKSLPQDTYFNVISFGTGNSGLFHNSVKYNDKQINQAIKQVKKMSANMGGTEIYFPLMNLLMKKPIDGYPKQIFLVTDGNVANTKTVLDMVEANSKYSRVHAIGIGNGASEMLVMGCAQRGKGYHAFITDDEDPSEKIIQLLTDSLSPVISKMKLKYDKEVIQSIIPNPQSLPYVLKGQIVNFYINFKGQLDKKTSLSFQYEDSLNKLPYASEIVIDPQSSNQSFIDRMGHFKKIKLLQLSLNSNANIEEFMYYVKKVDKKAEIINLSTKHQILSEMTAFISVQKELIDGKYEQIKNIGQINVTIPSIEPIQNEKGMMGIRKKCSMVPVSSIKPKQLEMKNSSAFLAKSSRPISNTSTAFRNHQPTLGVQKPLQMDKQKCEDTILKANEFCEDEQSIECEQQVKNIPKKEKKMKKAQQFMQAETKQSKSSKTIKKLEINEVISYQGSDGSWFQVELIERIFGINIVKQLLSEKQALEKKAAVITYLVVRWIEKYYPSKQYSLVTKKGMNFIKKQGIQIESLAILCGKVQI